MRKKNVVFTNKTGTGTSTEVTRRQLMTGGMLRLPVMAKVVATVGGSPNATLKLQGYVTAKADWMDIADDLTITEAGTYYIDAYALPRCVKYRLNITANTDVTVTSAEIGVGMVPT